jgi:hypothetical protein
LSPGGSYFRFDILAIDCTIINAFFRHGWTLAILSAKINPMTWLPHPPVCVIDWAKPGKNR